MNVREWALPVYTILMQLSVGALIVLWLLRYLGGSKFSPHEIDRIISNPILVIAFTAVVAMGGAHFHLSKPFQSYMAVLNFKSSWLSREIVFNVLFLITTTSLLYLTYFQTHRRKLITSLGWLASVFGVILIYCMARIYLLPTQVAWNSHIVILSFYVSTLLLGGMAIATLMVLDLKFAEIKKADDVKLRVQVIHDSSAGLTLLTIALVILSLVIISTQTRLMTQGDLIARTSLRLLVDLYLPLYLMRMTLLVYASASLGYAVIRMYRLQIKPQRMMTPVYISCLLILVGEIIGRFLFYATHIRVGL